MKLIYKKAELTTTKYLMWITENINKFPAYTHFCCNALVSFIFQQVPHHLQMIFLGRHVERSEAILLRQKHHISICTHLRYKYTLALTSPTCSLIIFYLYHSHLWLSIDICPSVHQQPHHFFLPRQWGDMEGGVSFLQSRNNRWSQFLSVVKSWKFCRRIWAE